MVSLFTGEFFFCKKVLQCQETVTNWIIFYIYTFSNIAPICSKLTRIIKQAHSKMSEADSLPEEFENLLVPQMNICWGITKLIGQITQDFNNYTHEMQEACLAHLTESDITAISFLEILLDYIKSNKL